MNRTGVGLGSQREERPCMFPRNGTAYTASIQTRARRLGANGWSAFIPRDRAKWQEAIDRAISEKSDYEAKFRLLLPDGATKYLHTAGHPVLNASGDLMRFVRTSMDITATSELLWNTVR